MPVSHASDIWKAAGYTGLWWRKQRSELEAEVWESGEGSRETQGE